MCLYFSVLIFYLSEELWCLKDYHCLKSWFKNEHEQDKVIVHIFIEKEYIRLQGIGSEWAAIHVPKKNNTRR